MRIVNKLKASAIFPQATNLACHWTAEIKYPERIKLGKGVVIGKSVTIGGLGGVTLGDNVKASKGVTIESAGLDFSRPAPYEHISKPIIIENDVWIGAGATILAGVTIGAGAVIGASTVVTKDIPSGAICVGPSNRIILK